MNEIEEKLNEEKKRRMLLQVAPLELEGRLRMALDSSTAQNSRRRLPTLWVSLAVSLMIFLFAGYHYNALAFYGKKILGFEQMFNHTLKELNEAGKGQIVNQTQTLSDGTELTVNGLMTDANRMIIYYTLTNPNGVEKAYSDLFQPNRITGLFTRADYEGGQGIINEAGTEFKGSMDFESPNPFAKKLSLHYWEYLDGGRMLEHKISLPYDPNQAMKGETKQSINQNVKVDQGEIQFHSILASPTVTVVSGKLHVDNFDRINLGLHDIELLANGKSVPIMGSGVKSSRLGGQNFEIDFDALPSNLKTLQLNVKKFVGYKELDTTITLNTEAQESYLIQEISQLHIREITSTSDGVEIKIATDESILLDGVYLITSKGRVELQTTIGQKFQKEQDGQVLKERTLLFKTNDEPQKLLIEGIHYSKEYNQMIEIPLD